MEVGRYIFCCNAFWFLNNAQLTVEFEMSDVIQAKDLVISYGVTIFGPTEGMLAVQQALEKGYRVVEIISTPMGGGACTNAGVAITVLLSHQTGDFVSFRSFQK